MFDTGSDGATVRPEWLFEIVNAIQRHQTACDPLLSVAGITTPDSELERRILHALSGRLGTSRAIKIGDRIETRRALEDDDSRGEPRTVVAAVDQAQKLLQSDYTNRWTVEQIARRVGRNRTDLEAAFRRHGLGSVHGYLIVVRVNAGMSLRLLKFSGGSVDDYAICRAS